MNDRLPTRLWVSALLRRASVAGGVATVIRRGEPDAGAVLIILRRKISVSDVFGRLSGLAGWRQLTQEAGLSDQDLAQFIEKQVKFDSDAWLIEIENCAVDTLLDEPVFFAGAAKK
jgi:hypothetical protein